MLNHSFLIKTRLNKSNSHQFFSQTLHKKVEEWKTLEKCCCETTTQLIEVRVKHSQHCRRDRRTATPQHWNIKNHSSRWLFFHLPALTVLDDRDFLLFRWWVASRKIGKKRISFSLAGTNRRKWMIVIVSSDLSRPKIHVNNWWFLYGARSSTGICSWKLWRVTYAWTFQIPFSSLSTLGNSFKRFDSLR